MQPFPCAPTSAYDNIRRSVAHSIDLYATHVYTDSPRLLIPLAAGLVLVVAIPTAAVAAVDLAALDNPARADAVQRYRRASDLLHREPDEAYRVADELPEFLRVDELRLELLARAALASARPERAADLLGSLGETSGTSRIGVWAALTLAELHVLGGRVEAAVATMSDVSDRMTGLSLRAAEARHYRSRLLRLRHDVARARGRTDRARNFARLLHLDYPATASAKRSGLSAPVHLDDADRFKRAKHLYDTWAYEEARDSFQSLLDNDAYTDTSHWYLGRIALDKLRDDAQRAERHFSKLAEDTSYASEALYQVARAQMSQEKYGEALDTLDTYEQRHPDGDHIEDVYYYRGWLPYDHRENRRALEGFEAYIERYGTAGPRSSYIHGFRSWTHMRMGAWRRAVESYGEMEVFGNMLVWGKALYWQAYALREMGENRRAIEKLDTLRETYPVTYYGVLGEQLRARIRGDDPRASEVWWPKDAGKADDSPRLDMRDYDYGLGEGERRRWRRVQALVVLDERERAREGLDPIYDEMRAGVEPSDRDAWIHAIGRFVGDFRRMWTHSTGGSISAMPQPPTPESLEAVMAYPRAYRETVGKVADEFDLPPYLLWSIMRQESRYSPGRISHADAVGALQMIPRTAKKVARDLGTTYNPRTFYRPEVGFRFSGYYMRKLLETFDGYFVPMAASYNSGPEIVAHWFEENPDASFPWLIEEFAYNEGRNYCRKVAEHMVRYLYLYESDADRRGRILNRLFPVELDVSLPDDVGY